MEFHSVRTQTSWPVVPVNVDRSTQRPKTPDASPPIWVHYIHTLTFKLNRVRTSNRRLLKHHLIKKKIKKNITIKQSRWKNHLYLKISQPFVCLYPYLNPSIRGNRLTASSFRSVGWGERLTLRMTLTFCCQGHRFDLVPKTPTFVFSSLLLLIMLPFYEYSHYDCYYRWVVGSLRR